MKPDRRQITLYVPHPHQTRIDRIRKQVNPAQYALIAAHVTLCRDEEVHDWSALMPRARELVSIELTLRFGAPVKENDLVYLPVVGPTDDFDQLRVQLLQNEQCRKQDPHITIVHPRNGCCNDQQFQAIQEWFCQEFTVRFEAMTFIEQDAGLPWRDVFTFPESMTSPRQNGTAFD